MPYVFVYGVPDNVPAISLNNFVRPQIQKVIAGIAVLNVSEGDVIVHFPRENTGAGYSQHRSDISVLIYLYKRPQRTESVLMSMCEAVAKEIKTNGLAKNVSVGCDAILLNSRTSYTAR